MGQIIYKDRNIVFSNNPNQIVKNATVEEIDENTLRVTGELMHTKHITEGYPYFNFLLNIDKSLRDNIINKSNTWNQSPTPYNKPKVLDHIYSEDRNIFFKILKFFVESLSFELIKLPNSFTLKMKEGFYTTGFTAQVDMKITDAE